MNNEIIEWKNKLELINKNLIELSNVDFVKKIRNNMTGLNAITYTGKTYSYGKECIDLLDKLWNDYRLMDETVQSADELYKKQGVFKDYSPEINKLLHGSIITVFKNNVPLEKRDLTYDSQISLTMEQAQELMIDQFSQARDKLILLRDVEKSVENSISIIKKESDELNKLQISLGQKINIEVFEQINTFKNDPLLAMECLSDAKKNLSVVRSKLQKINNLKINIKQKIEDAKTKLEKLKSLIGKQDKICSEIQVTFLPIPIFVNSVAPEVVISYENWIKYLDEAYADASVLSSLNVGVQKCLEAIDKSIKEEEIHCEKNREYLTELEELQGRFRAYRAKYQSLVFTASTDIAILIETIKNALYSKPVDLSIASKLVRSFELILSNKN
ncbi:MAG: hypothetical protein H7263_19255 [Candidatus Sericytochromatia bacterium]|nr:hypothetical protein [Candidatus Sericytochromatia bacterium]